jgi:hypothetical protein
MAAPTRTLGGGSSAVAASSHAACARFRGTDPLVTGLTRRKLAETVGFPDVNGSIPEARWMRAVTFERLVRDRRFASQVATTTVGALALERPTAVVIVDARVNADRTAELLEAAHVRAIEEHKATLIHGLAVPFLGFEATHATEVKPDFAVVAQNLADDGLASWLVVGDAKDYERLRSRIADSRLLKGFLQVAVGAESCEMWSRLPAGMQVHSWGVLAVPRNAFLQPEALVENISDHRAEVRMRVGERRKEASAASYDAKSSVKDYAAHLKATFDPASCVTCTLFGFCRDELRRSSDPADLLIELGISADLRSHVMGLVDGGGEDGTAAPASVVANVIATQTGVGCWTGQRRIDQAGLPGTVNVVVAKSDATALGLHGLAVQRVSSSGRREWTTAVYEDPHHPDTRRAAMRAIGKELIAAMGEMRKVDAEAPPPVHLVVPDKVTTDVLVSIADNLAGIELSRLRWQQDKTMGRPALTFDGEPATVPKALSMPERTAVSFLLEEDRARTFKVRSPIVDVRVELANHLVAGGPPVNSLRLDYLVAWSNGRKPVEHRVLADEIELSVHTPGARLVKATSDGIHSALTGRGKRGREGAANPKKYRRFVEAELAYKAKVLGKALDSLEPVEDSNLRDAHRAVEGAAQEVWRRRLAFHASDLVRFGRTYRRWRNDLVGAIEEDATCHEHLLALANPHVANGLATDAGTRQVAFVTVVSVDPLVLDIESRRIGEGDRVVLLHVNDQPCVEAEDVTVDTSLKGSFKIDGLSIGPLDRDSTDASDPVHRFGWTPHTTPPSLQQGDRAIVADFAWFSKNTGNRQLNVPRPAPDNDSAPGKDCTSDSYDEAPHRHQFCCRPHERAEAEFSDKLAERRERGELNPETWPPIHDDDAFEVGAKGAPQGNPDAEPAEPAPDNVTLDDLE